MEPLDWEGKDPEILQDCSLAGLCSFSQIIGVPIQGFVLNGTFLCRGEMRLLWNNALRRLCHTSLGKGQH